MKLPDWWCKQLVSHNLIDLSRTSPHCFSYFAGNGLSRLPWTEGLPSFLQDQPKLFSLQTILPTKVHVNLVRRAVLEARCINEAWAWQNIWNRPAAGSSGCLVGITGVANRSLAQSIHLGLGLAIGMTSSMLATVSSAMNVTECTLCA